MIRIAAWALYDFANTLYSLSILSYHFPLWLVENGVKAWQYALLMGFVSLVAALLMPVFGFVSDRFGSPRILVAVPTLFCVLFTVFMGLSDSLLFSIVVFCVGQTFYQFAQIPYNALMPQVAKGRKLGGVSGFGVAAGYMGTIAAIFVLRPFFEEGGHQATFIPTAVLFLFFALPCLAATSDEGGGKGSSFGRWIHRLTDYRPSRVALLLGRSLELRVFAIFSFLILNVVAVVGFFMTLFAREAAGLTPSETDAAILLAALGGILGALLSGKFYDRAGSVKALRSVAIIWVMAIGLNFGYGYKPCFFGVVLLVGFALGSTWSVSRVYLLEIVRPGELAEYYGIFGLLGKVAALTGPVAVALVLKVFEADKNRAFGVMNLVLFVLSFAAWGIIRHVSYPKKS